MYHCKSLFLASFVAFGCLNANWTTSPTTIDSGSASSSAPLVVDEDGNVTSAWLENFDPFGDDPQAAFFSSTSLQWEAPQNIIQAYAGLTPGQLIVDSFGTVTMVWLEYFNVNANSITLFASRSTQGGPWTTPVALNSLPSTTPTNAIAPASLVVDAQGNVTVVWLEQNLMTMNYAIGSARFTSDINVGPTTYPFLDGMLPNANSSVFPNVVVDSLGYVTAVWQEQTMSGFAVQASRLDPMGMAWSIPVNLDDPMPNANSAITPQMVVDGSGIVTTVWQENTGSEYAVQAARFVPGMGGMGGSWTTYTSLAPALADASSSLTPRLVVDQNGSVTLVAVDTGLSVWPSSFAFNASSWTYPSSPLNSGFAYVLTPLSLVADSSGTVTILWQNNDSGQLFVQAARGFSTSWGAAVSLDGGNSSGNTPLLLGVDPLGTVTASWIEGSEMQAARFLWNGSSWSLAAVLNEGNIYNLIPPKMVIGPAGGVTVAWMEGPGMGPYAVQASHFSPGKHAWSGPATLNNGIQMPNAYYSPMTQVLNMVVDQCDNVTVTWLEGQGSFIVTQAARFEAPPPPPPASGSASITTNGQNASIAITSGGKLSVSSGTGPAANTKIAALGASSSLNVLAAGDVRAQAGDDTNTYTVLEASSDIQILSGGDIVLKAGSGLNAYALMQTTQGGDVQLGAAESIQVLGGQLSTSSASIITKEGGDIGFVTEDLTFKGNPGVHSKAIVIASSNQGSSGINGIAYNDINFSEATIATGIQGTNISFSGGNNVNVEKRTSIAATAVHSTLGTSHVVLAAGQNMTFDSTSSISTQSHDSLVELVVDGSNPMSAGSGAFTYPIGAKIQTPGNQGLVRIYTASPMNNTIETNAIINGLAYPPPTDVPDHEVYSTFFPAVPPPPKDGSINYTIYYKVSP